MILREKFPFINRIVFVNADKQRVLMETLCFQLGSLICIKYQVKIKVSKPGPISNVPVVSMLAAITGTPL